MIEVFQMRFGCVCRYVTIDLKLDHFDGKLGRTKCPGQLYLGESFRRHYVKYADAELGLCVSVKRSAVYYRDPFSTQRLAGW
jgi:hypothetical protein